jgi:hypothetical protein
MTRQPLVHFGRVASPAANKKSDITSMNFNIQPISISTIIPACEVGYADEGMMGLQQSFVRALTRTA